MNRHNILAHRAREACRRLLIEIDQCDCPADRSGRRHAVLKERVRTAVHAMQNLIVFHSRAASERQRWRDRRATHEEPIQ